MASPKLEDFSGVLIVEGYSDLLFFAELCEWIFGGEVVFIKEMGGKGNIKPASLKTFLSPRLLQEKKAVGVITDADESEAGRVQSLTQCLRTLTGQEVKNGAWTDGPPRIGLFVVPGGGRTGEIETLMWQAWGNDPANDAVKACVDTFLDCMQGQGRVPQSIDKGRLSALLAVVNDEDPRLGPGARAKKFDFGRPELAELVEFLRAVS
jgi:hypothetical protein